MYVFVQQIHEWFQAAVDILKYCVSVWHSNI
jgi:hypothetical protein